MKDECFYKVKITKQNKTEIYHWGYFKYKMILDDVKKEYKDGADVVELEMIGQNEFDKIMKPYTSGH